jgi:hypothetical protein
MTAYQSKQQNISPLGQKIGTFLVKKTRRIETAKLNAE